MQSIIPWLNLARKGEAGRAQLYISFISSCFLVCVLTVGSMLLTALGDAHGKTRHRVRAMCTHKSSQAIIIGLVVACVEPLKQMLHGEGGGLSWLEVLGLGLARGFRVRVRVGSRFSPSAVCRAGGGVGRQMAWA